MIHSHALVHPDAKLGFNVTVEAFSVIEKDVSIGDNSWIGPHVTIMSGASIGRDCRIFPGAVIAAIPQDLKFGGEQTRVIIGDRVTVREYATINRGTKALGMTKIGNDVLIMAYVHIAHDCIIGNNCVLANATNLAGHIEIGDWAIIGGQSAIHQFCKIGSHAFLSGGSLVGKDVPPYVKAARVPLSYAGVNSIGLRRRGFDDKRINHVLDIYRILFVRHKNREHALEQIEAEIPVSKERDEIIAFCRNSVRGLMKGFTSVYEN